MSTFMRERLVLFSFLVLLMGLVSCQAVKSLKQEERGQSMQDTADRSHEAEPTKRGTEGRGYSSIVLISNLDEASGAWRIKRKCALAYIEAWLEQKDLVYLDPHRLGAVMEPVSLYFENDKGVVVKQIALSGDGTSKSLGKLMDLATYCKDNVPDTVGAFTPKTSANTKYSYAKVSISAKE